VAKEHGRTAARNMAGKAAAHEAVPYFWSDLSDWTGLEYVGAGSAAGAPVVRGSLDDGSFSAWALEEDGRVVSCVAVGGGSDDLDEARRMIREGAKPDPGALADAGTDLAEL
jgi:3-phenylpropionate/trans-cinnamate dioxygenase ferredoxin reductase subunit